MSRHSRFVVVAALVVGLFSQVTGARALTLLPPPPPIVRIVVQQWAASDPGPRTVLATLGGTVNADLPVINGFSASLREDRISTLAAAVGVRAVSLDTRVLATDGPAPDGGAPSVHKDVLDAPAAQTAGYRGAGVTVAVIDTGITDVPGLDGRLLTVDGATGPATCVNFSSEAGCYDNYGHGTFVAGLVHDIAPDANLLSVKLSGRDGSSDVTHLLQAIDWVLTNKHRYGIKVVNLSLATYSPLSYRIDPVNLAVERMWSQGITVVVAAGNQGPGASSVAKPADDPWVLTVGSTDDQGTVGLADDVVSSFSSRGPSIPDGVVKPDIVVPGRSLISLRSPGSAADLAYPNFVDTEHRRGTGTSFSTPLTAGAAAVLMAADPNISNDDVKGRLVATGRQLANPAGAGTGTFDLVAALASTAPAANQNSFHPLFWPAGTASLTDVTGSVFLLQWLGGQVTGSNWTGSNWTGSNWTGSNWTGSNWTGSNWTGSNWTTADWTGSNWTGSNWTGSNWTGSNWTGSNWTGSAWQGSNWTGSNWTGCGWS